MQVTKKQIEGDTLLESAEDKVSVVQVREGLTLELDMEEGAMLCAILGNIQGQVGHPVRMFADDLFFEIRNKGVDGGRIGQIEEEIAQPMRLVNQETILPTVVK